MVPGRQRCLIHADSFDRIAKVLKTSARRREAQPDSSEKGEGVGILPGPVQQPNLEG